MIEIGRNGDGSLDELAARDVSLVHIEQVDDDLWHMNIHTDLGVVTATMRGLTVQASVVRPD